MIREWVIKKYLKLDDCIGYIENIENLEEKHEVLTKAVEHLFNTVGVEDILQLKPDGSWSYRDKSIPPQQAVYLQRSMEEFRDSDLYKVLLTDLKHQANKKMFAGAKDMTDMLAGKMLLYYIDIVNTRLKVGKTQIK